MSISDKKVVQNQYATSARLETRISIHEKYSRNKQPFGEWIVSHYDLRSGEDVLELGCGTGSMWQGVIPPECCHVTLTDLSAGMLETARHNTAHLHAGYAVCDAMALPYADHTFDVVIANMMLYHVPDIARALREIRRVLKPEGRFLRRYDWRARCGRACSGYAQPPLWRQPSLHPAKRHRSAQGALL